MADPIQGFHKYRTADGRVETQCGGLWYVRGSAPCELDAKLDGIAMLDLPDCEVDDDIKAVRELLGDGRITRCKTTKRGSWSDTPGNKCGCGHLDVGHSDLVPGQLGYCYHCSCQSFWLVIVEGV
jgi:hypothetical protein